MVQVTALDMGAAGAGADKPPIDRAAHSRSPAGSLFVATLVGGSRFMSRIDVVAEPGATGSRAGLLAVEVCRDAI